MGAVSARAGCNAVRMWGPATGSGPTTMCAKPPQVAEQNGHVDYCRDSGPCGVGEGDCDGSSQCQSGLQCSQDVGANYGFRADYDGVRSRLKCGGRTGTWTTVGTLGRVGWAKATAIVPANVRAGSSAAGMWGQATGSRRPTMCAKPPQVRGRTGTWTTVGTLGRVVWGEGDCDGSGECESGLECSQDVGATLRVPGGLRCVRVA